MIESTAKSKAYANIALAKYWGKSDDVLNIPAVPSLSLTLAPLETQTEVSIDNALPADEIFLGGVRLHTNEASRMVDLLNTCRTLSERKSFARIVTSNSFPTASGLASSASGFAALALGARDAYGLPMDLVASSRLARKGSASAARSIYTGYVGLRAGEVGDDSVAAEPLYSRSHWDLRVVVAVLTESKKDVSSRSGMTLSKETSPYYQAWVERAPGLYTEVETAVRNRDLEALSFASEQNFWTMHSVAHTSMPSLRYMAPGSLSVLDALTSWRRDGLVVAWTMDAGPHVKIFCDPGDAQIVEQRLLNLPAVVRTIVARPA